MESLFDFPQFKITKKIRLIELFGGIGSQAMALRDIGADFEHYKLVEFDKYAVQSYNAIHNTQHTTHDIRDIHANDLEIKDKDKYCYLMTYSFPCTDLSGAGKMQGMSKEDWKNGKSTRSGLLWEVERILKECTKEELPDVLLMENVPQVHAEQNRADFDNWLNFLKSKEYKNFWKDLNAKDFGIPQNRDRCFCVSFLSDDNFMEYEFPESVKLQTVMKDYLEEEVDEKYYINNEKSEKLIKQLVESGVLSDSDKTDRQTDRQTDGSGVVEETSNKLITGIDLYIKNPKERQVANCITALYNNHGICNHAQEGNGVIEKWQIPLVVDKNDDNGNYVSSSEAKLFVNDEPIARTLTCKCGGGQEVHHNNMVCVAMRGRNPEHPTDRTPGIHGYCNNCIQQAYRIRKLTPKECWRLMGYTDEDFEKASRVNSNTQLYKQAGNAIVKQVLMAIFSKML